MSDKVMGLVIPFAAFAITVATLMLWGLREKSKEAQRERTKKEIEGER